MEVPIMGERATDSVHLPHAVRCALHFEETAMENCELRMRKEQMGQYPREKTSVSRTADQGLPGSDQINFG